MNLNNNEIRDLQRPARMFGKGVPVLNLAQRHEDVLGAWKYSSMHS
jgi:hypothetical protein